MSKKKIDDKDLSNEDLGKLHELLSKINREVKQDMWFSKQKKYKTKQWIEFAADWRMNFNQRLLNNKFTLKRWKEDKNLQILSELVEPLRIIIDHPKAYENKILKQAKCFCGKLYQITTKIRKHSIDKDAKRQTSGIIKKCAEKLAEEGYNYYQHYGHWLIALCNHITESNESKKQKLMIEQFKKDYHSELGRIILRRPKELQIRLGSALVELYDHNKKMIEMVTPQNLESLKDDKMFLEYLAMYNFIPVIGRQCDKWKEHKFEVSKYDSFRHAFESGNFNALLDVVILYLYINIMKSNENKPKS